MPFGTDLSLPATGSLMNSFFFFFQQKTAYEISECDWSSDVCSSDLTLKTLVDSSLARMPPAAPEPMIAKSTGVRRSKETLFVIVALLPISGGVVTERWRPGDLMSLEAD